MEFLYPIRLEASLHETIWGGRRLERDGWKRLPSGDIAIGEAWETEVSTVAQNGPYAGKTLGELVELLGPALLGEEVLAIFGRRFPLLAKFIDANAQLSVQVHPDDAYAAIHERGQLGKTEFWYVLAAEPDAVVVYGFKCSTTRAEVQRAIQEATLETLLHEEHVVAGDIIFVPAGTVHAIGSGVMLYELQEYSDLTYRMYDYGRLTAAGIPRPLHIERSLDVSRYESAQRIKVKPVLLVNDSGYEDHCLVACRYFVTRELHFTARNNTYSSMQGKTTGSCIILSSLGAKVRVYYGPTLKYNETLSKGQTMVLPAALGNYRIEGQGRLAFSYVPTVDDKAWQAWRTKNEYPT